VFDLDTRVDLDKVMPALLVDQEFSGTSVSVVYGIGELDSIAQDSLSDILCKMRRRSDLDHLLVSSLNRAVSFVKVDTVTVAVCQKLDFDVSRVIQESCERPGTSISPRPPENK
jgi:hypothetical protein